MIRRPLTFHPTTRRVIKLGGSLLTRPGLLDDVHAWLTAQTAADTCVIVGGGRMIDAVRQWDQLRRVDQREVHWMCVEMLKHSVRHLANAFLEDDRFADVSLLETDSQWHHYQTNPVVPASSKGSSLAFLVPGLVYHRGCDAPLPENWSTTTDSIAMWVAMCCQADEVVLLKSCEVPVDGQLDDWIDEGIVDSACGALSHMKDQLRVERLPACK